MPVSRSLTRACEANLKQGFRRCRQAWWIARRGQTIAAYLRHHQVRKLEAVTRGSRLRTRE